MLDVQNTAIPEVKIITPRRFQDDRGYFYESYNKERFDKKVAPFNFVQDNVSFSAQKGTIRGLHFQHPPFAQDKLVSVIKGSIWDVAVDIRKDSATYGQYVGAELSAETGQQLLVPAGFAHGFCTLEADTIVSYKVTNFYSAGHDAGIIWNDPHLAIDWPLEHAPVLSDKDMNNPLFKQ